MYTIYNGLLPHVINVLYIRNKDILPTIVRISTYRGVSKGSMNFVNISTRLWNVLLLNTDVNLSITTFKHNIKTFYYTTPLN